MSPPDQLQKEPQLSAQKETETLRITNSQFTHQTPETNSQKTRLLNRYPCWVPALGYLPGDLHVNVCHYQF